LIKSDSKDIYNVTKYYTSNKCCSFELSIHQRIMNKHFYITVFNIDANNEHFLYHIRFFSEGSCDTEM